MSRSSISAAAVALLCLAPAASRADSHPAAQHPIAVMPATPLAALPPGTAPPPTLVIAPVPPAAGATQPAVPPVPPAAQGVPFAPTPYAAVFARSLPGSALRAVTPDELARRGTFVPTPLVSGMQPGLAADEVLLTCTLPEALPRLAAAPSTGSKPARAAPSRKEGTR